VENGQFQYRKGISNVEQQFEACKEKFNELLKDSEPKMQGMSEDKKIIHLKYEDKMVREELKRLNLLITQLVESRREALKKKGKTFKCPNTEFYVKELQNAEKQLNNAETEYQKVSTRLTQISDPQYATELKERIIALSHRIKKAGKSKKSMEIEQLLREKRMEKTIEDGQSEFLSEINQIKSEESIIEKKHLDIDAEISKNTENLSEQNKKLAEVKEKFLKMCEEAKKYGIDPDLLGELSKEEKEKLEKNEELFKKKDYLNKEINLIKTRSSVTLGDYIQKKTNLQKQLTVISKNLIEKNEYFYSYFSNNIKVLIISYKKNYKTV